MALPLLLEARQRCLARTTPNRHTFLSKPVEISGPSSKQAHEVEVVKQEISARPPCYATKYWLDQRGTRSVLRILTFCSTVGLRSGRSRSTRRWFIGRLHVTVKLTCVLQNEANKSRLFKQMRRPWVPRTRVQGTHQAQSQELRRSVHTTQNGLYSAESRAKQKRARERFADRPSRSKRNCDRQNGACLPAMLAKTCLVCIFTSPLGSAVTSQNRQSSHLGTPTRCTKA